MVRKAVLSYFITQYVSVRKICKYKFLREESNIRFSYIALKFKVNLDFTETTQEKRFFKLPVAKHRTNSYFLMLAYLCILFISSGYIE